MQTITILEHDRQIALTDGPWHFGDARDLLGDIAIDAIDRPVMVQRDGEMIAIIAHSEDMPSGRSCLSRSAPREYIGGTATGCGLKVQVRLVEARQSFCFEHEEHDLLEIISEEKTILSLN